MVGTARNTVGFSLSITASVSATLKRGSSRISEPLTSARFMTPVMPKTWNNGRIASTFSRPWSIALAQIRICAVLAVRLAWVSSAALGSPVVPPVYCMTATSRRGSISASAGMPSLAVSLANLTCAASLGIAATSRRLNSAKSARLGKARAPPMSQTTRVSRQVSSRRRATLG